MEIAIAGRCMTKRIHAYQPRLRSLAEASCRAFNRFFGCLLQSHVIRKVSLRMAPGVSKRLNIEAHTLLCDGVFSSANVFT